MLIGYTTNNPTLPPLEFGIHGVAVLQTHGLSEFVPFAHGCVGLVIATMCTEMPDGLVPKTFEVLYRAAAADGRR